MKVANPPSAPRFARPRAGGTGSATSAPVSHMGLSSITSRPTASRALLGLGLLTACSGCSTVALPGWLPGGSRGGPVAGETPRPVDPARAGTPPAQVREPDPAEGLYRLGLLQADPASGQRDYRAARATFTRLLSEYPRSRWDAEARAWQSTLTDLLVREDEARRYAQRLRRVEEESRRTKTNLEWLKQTDLEREPRK